MFRAFLGTFFATLCAELVCDSVGTCSGVRTASLLQAMVKSEVKTEAKGAPLMQEVAEVYNDPRTQEIYCYLKEQFSDVARDEAVFARLGKESCALVSTSGALVANSHGADIDSHDMVLRFHNSPVGGWEKSVGSRTDMSLDGTSEGLTFSARGLRWSLTGFQEVAKAVFARLYPQRMGMHHVPTGGVHDPTTGSKGMLAALANCRRVDAYEMAPSVGAHAFPYHYYDVPGGKDNIGADDNDWHGMIMAEHDLWRRISVASANESDSGKTSYPGFSTVKCPKEVEVPMALGLMEED